ncbi:hypothetical protein NPIL_378451 [Nephila pilipes]|uniref:Uncharacterized protein n=1 Tax=Nephila pilipes TaxID=299642 RepID=A0A8X6KQQ2_NEPPI|nr:hypothetical protein NPIL_293821 [Nephila pilipes]GFT41367.1 hypothetical protein NPIL_667591 [Nephila pilipes]GFU24229.1 hypothetical protein NPIL_450351 [Nephila pilipes]GFU50667.1 hypothetical protein NPIL_378451 [Nephila pilipes]
MDEKPMNIWDFPGTEVESVRFYQTKGILAKITNCDNLEMKFYISETVFNDVSIFQLVAVKERLESSKLSFLKCVWFYTKTIQDGFYYNNGSLVEFAMKQTVSL